MFYEIYFNYAAIVYVFLKIDSFAQRFKIEDGQWKGLMSIQKEGQQIDSVDVHLTIKTIHPDSVWQWKMEYLSTKMPVTKDYQLRIANRHKNIFITDEGDGVQLTEYLFGRKMFSQFETQGIFLTSMSEWKENGDILFEVTSAKKTTAPNKEVNPFTIGVLQTVVLKKQ